MPQLSPDTLIHAIAMTQSAIKVIGEAIERLHPVDAAALVRRYPREHWTAELRKNGEVKSIRRSKTPGAPWQHCYRTAEAPVLQPGVEWLQSRRGL